MRISDWSSDVCSSDLLRSKRDVAIFGKKLVERRSLEAFAIARPKSGVGGQNPDAARRKQGLSTEPEIGRAHVGTPVTNAHLVCRLLLEKNNKHTLTKSQLTSTTLIINPMQNN